MAQRPIDILVVGGGYGGISAISSLLNLADGNRQLPCAVPIEQLTHTSRANVNITLLDRRDGIFHLMGSPLSFVSNAFAEEAWLRYNDVAYLKDPRVRVIHGNAQSIDIATREASYSDLSSVHRKLRYDYLVLAAGKAGAWPVVPRASSKDQHITDVGEQLNKLACARRVAVIGGGAVGVEMAAEIKKAFPGTAVTLIHSRPSLLSSEPLPDTFKVKTLEMTRNAGVEVLLETRVASRRTVPEGNGTMHVLQLLDGHELQYDCVVDAAATTNDTIGHTSAADLMGVGSVNILPTLQLDTAQPYGAHHFVIGDAAPWTGIKRAGNAMIMGQYAASNILQMIAQQQGAGDDQGATSAADPLFECPDFETMIVLSIGDQAIAYTKDTGVSWGKEVKENFVGRGMGIDRCSEYLRFARTMQA
ncbi:hypothetical protein LTR56_025561 [Elasticomyces elasticus]|nr:hypothetical protein LTR56_025561 [Elasticomyces elasticus]KAK3649905.1 hypothetical protein LTR22_012781 [Elasticomyces elasticus]KAK4918144.1 hypothetical protein LTR49_014000 [Elasticomyces elasticus]KAK5757690.1 hypothetical protein LTS12_012149 [Elasticomyces elasticus]